jgi:hypothetical protein
MPKGCNKKRPRDYYYWAANQNLLLIGIMIGRQLRALVWLELCRPLLRLRVDVEETHGPPLIEPPEAAGQSSNREARASDLSPGGALPNQQIRLAETVYRSLCPNASPCRARPTNDQLVPPFLRR